MAATGLQRPGLTPPPGGGQGGGGHRVPPVRPGRGHLHVLVHLRAPHPPRLLSRQVQVHQEPDERDRPARGPAVSHPTLEKQLSVCVSVCQCVSQVFTERSSVCPFVTFSTHPPMCV